MKKIILDTNFLMAVSQFKIDIFLEIERICDFKYRLCIIDGTIEELNRIAENSNGKDGRAAKIALLLVKSKDIEVIETKKDKSTDDLIIDIANKDFIVATQDKALKSRLKKKNIGLITIRQKGYVRLE